MAKSREHRKPIKFYTRDDCDLIIQVDSDSGDCYIVPIAYSQAKKKALINFKDLQNFKERWDFIAGNDFLSITQNRIGLSHAELQNKLRAILPKTPLPSEDNALVVTFYENCPRPLSLSPIS